MCRLLLVSSAGFYNWLKRDQTILEEKNRVLNSLINTAFTEGRGSYGSPRVHSLLRSQKVKCSRGTVARRMVELGLRAKGKKKFKKTTDSSHPYQASPNLLKREFNPILPNKAWVSDITYVATSEGWLYLATVIDLFSRKIIGWGMSDTLHSDIALDALKMAIKQRGCGILSELIFHSDRGVQYACKSFRNLLNVYQIKQSMSGKGNCWDNAPAESFFHTLKVEHLYGKKLLTKLETRASIFEWIEVFYNRRRIHSTLGQVAPEEFERRFYAKVS